MVSLQTSRFALLNIDEDSDGDSRKSKGKNPLPGEDSKRKNKKKKSSAKQKVPAQPQKPVASRFHGKGDCGPATDEQWDEWLKADSQHTDNEYEKELHSALEQSRLTFEQEKKTKSKENIKTSDGQSGTNGSKKQKKNRSQKSALSLDEFQKLGSASSTEPSQSNQKQPQEVSHTPEATKPEPTFFVDVEKDVADILQREQNKENIVKKFAAESATLFRCQELMANKDKELEEKEEDINNLRAENEKLQKELVSVRKRNQQLAVILSQGEMKDKSEVLQELEELRQERTELSAEVTSLTALLEREISKNHQLQKGGKK